MSAVRLQNVTRLYGRLVAVRNVSLEIGAGEFVTILGASGCGKTTCLRMVAGFVAPNSGCIFIGGRDITAVPARSRNCAMVFQHYALFPHLSVRQNVAFGLNVRRLPGAEVAART